MAPLLLLLFASSLCSASVINTKSGVVNYHEKWGYVNVRPNAHMFWWLYSQQPEEQGPCNNERPLILWLQGGPGGSSTGFGNFGEMGPLDVNLKPRKSTWLQKADLLFVDNPVGAGFSYVTSDSAYTTDVHQIAVDLLTFFKRFSTLHPEYQKRPFHIFCESYGGKMTAAFAALLYKAVKAQEIQCNFKGIALGDSWISPIDFVLAWGPYLYHMSFLDEASLQRAQKQANICLKNIENGQWYQATSCWSQMESLVISITDGVSFYNVLELNNLVSDSWRLLGPKERLMRTFLYDASNSGLSALMNGPIRKKLGIIPTSVTWGGQMWNVFSKQMNDFMKPVVDIVDDLIANTTLNVAVYEGQLDLICATVGAEAWLKTLKWAELPQYRKQKHAAFHAGPPAKYHQTAGFYKKYKNFGFFWILRAGHMVPVDAPDAALKMLDLILSW